MEAAQNVPAPYKCQRCGRQSPVEAAFAIRKRANGNIRRCLCFECENRRTSNSTLLLYLLLPVFGALILLISPNSRIGFFYLLVFAGLLVSIPLIVLHELSHALTAQALGFRVFTIHIGLGRVLFSRRISGISWTVHMIPSSGATLVSGPEMPNYRARIFLIHLAGPLFHVLLTILLLWMHRLFTISGLWYDLLLWTNVCLLVFNLVPYRARVAVGTTGTDGWAMLNAPRLAPENLRNRYVSYYILETIRAIEGGDVSAACASAETGITLYPENANMHNTLGYAYINSGEYVKARQVFLQALDSNEEVPLATKAILLNNVAFANIMLDDPSLIPQADDFSEKAFELFPWEPSIIGTRGSALAASGQFQEGIDLLKSAFQKQPDKRFKAQDACLLAWAEWKRGNPEKANTYLAQARQLDPDCLLLGFVQGKMRPGTQTATRDENVELATDIH